MKSNEQRTIVGAEHLQTDDYDRFLPLQAILCLYQYQFLGMPILSLEELAQLNGGAGINCQYLTHELLGWLFDVNIPPEYLSKELFEVAERDEYFASIPVGNNQSIQRGDVLLFENTNLQSRPDYGPMYFHPVLVIGLTADDNPLCIHILSFLDKSRHPVEIWRLEDFARSKYHQNLMAIRRPRKLMVAE